MKKATGLIFLISISVIWGCEEPGLCDNGIDSLKGIWKLTVTEREYYIDENGQKTIENENVDMVTVAISENGQITVESNGELESSCTAPQKDICSLSVECKAAESSPYSYSKDRDIHLERYY